MFSKLFFAERMSHLIVVNAVHAFSIDARVVDAVVLVDFAIFAVRSWQTFAGVTRADSVNATASVLARVGRTFIDRSITKVASVARMASALVSVNTVAMDAGINVTLNIFTPVSTETDAAVAYIRIVAIASASPTVQAGVIIATVIDDFFASFSCKAYGTGASKTVDKVGTDSSVTTGI